MLNRLKDFILSDRKLDKEAEEETSAAYLPREKILVFSISFVLAFCLWFIVNLSRDFNITVHLPLEVGDLPEEMALVSNPPENASVGVSGEGWKLISLYNNPPRIVVHVDEQEVNLFERVQRQVSLVSDVNITQVDPVVLSLELEEQASKEVPVEPFVEITTSERHGMIGDTSLEPQMVTVTGGASKIREIDGVRTAHTKVDNVKENQEIELIIEQPETGVTVTPDRVLYRFNVTEFTEGETRIPIRIRNLPPGQAITYNPSTVTVRYDVPIGEYRDVQNSRPFTAYVDYSTIAADTTGLLVPQIERTEDEFNVRLRSFQPRTVTYFNVVQ